MYYFHILWGLMGIGHKIIRIAHQNIPHAPPPPTTSLCRCTYKYVPGKTKVNFLSQKPS